MEEEKEKAMDLLKVKGDEDIGLLNTPTPDVPVTYMDKLPSGFKGYPKGTKIGYKPMTLEELEILSIEDEDWDNENENESKANLAIAYLLKSIVCNTLEPEDLYYWDLMYIGIKRKMLAFGGTQGTVYGRCSKCGNILAKKFDYTELQFKELEVPALPLKIQLSGRNVEFGQITMKDFLQIEPSQGQLGVYARMIKNMEFDEAYNFVKNLYGMDIKKIKFVDNQLNFGLKPLEMICENEFEEDNPNYDESKPVSETNKRTLLKPCGEKNFLEVTSLFEVVFPEDKDGGADEFEVQYG